MPLPKRRPYNVMDDREVVAVDITILPPDVIERVLDARKTHMAVYVSCWAHNPDGDRYSVRSMPGHLNEAGRAVLEADLLERNYKLVLGKPQC